MHLMWELGTGPRAVTGLCERVGGGRERMGECSSQLVGVEIRFGAGSCGVMQ